MSIPLLKQLYDHFDQHKLPSRENLKNTLIRDYEVDPNQVEACIDHFRSDGLFGGLISSVSGAEQVMIEQAKGSKPAHETALEDDEETTSERVPDLRLLNGPREQERMLHSLVPRHHKEF